MKINFHFEKPIQIPQRKKLKSFIADIFLNNKKHLKKLDYVFCSDEYLLDINKRFLKHDFYTDIITFDLSDNIESICGEIYISIDMVKENASLFKSSLQQELHRVIFHGALHLCGFKDKKPSDFKIMKEQEATYLEKYFNAS